MKKAFVTGATGFLGINLIEALLEDHWQVTALILPEDPILYLDQSKIRFVRGDIMSLESLRAVMPEGEEVTVFHLAGITTMWRRQDSIQYQINVIGTKNICEISIEKGVGKFVFTSSISAYGYHSCRVNEETISNAMTCKMNYNRTKYLGEMVIHRAIQQGLNAVILNPCNIIGPFDTKGWATLIKSVNEGNNRGATDGIATFAHVKDVVNGHIKAADQGQVGENYLLGGVEVSFKEVVESICKMLDKKPPKKSISPLILKLVMIIQSIKSLFDQKMPLLTYPRYKRLTGHIVCDDSKARAVLGYETRPLQEMLQDSYDWLKREALL